MNLIRYMLAILSAVVLWGCAAAPEHNESFSTVSRSDVYREIGDVGPPTAGFADLRIAASFKTHLPGKFSSSDPHGTDAYALFINIDGQAMRLRGEIREESDEGRWFRDPEAGNGVRYRLHGEIRLKGGKRKCSVTIPVDGISVERDLELQPGANQLILQPIYAFSAGKRRPGFYGTTDFMAGLKGFRMVLNGETL